MAHTHSREFRATSPITARSVELFSGCGGLAMGLSLAGFSHELLVERDSHACSTLAHNKSRGARHVEKWLVESSDVRAIDWKPFADTLDLVAGGPPCQPFSIGGKAAGNDDDRDMWPEAVRAVRETMPKAFVFENVKGLLRPRFEDYVSWIAAYLANPCMEKRSGESHAQHLARLRGRKAVAQYCVNVVPVNAADYGAPQKRHRVLFVGFRKDLVSEPVVFPAPTHSQQRLVWDKWISGEYWEAHSIPRPAEKYVPAHEAAILQRLRRELFAPEELRWATCRDAFKGLGEPSMGHQGNNHKFQAGARSYVGHTGSPIDEPSKALKAGVHGVPGGENMLAFGPGKVRYFTLREAARLQGLPDDFGFPGSWSESMRQIGNAVPVQLSRFAGTWVSAVLSRASQRQ